MKISIVVLGALALQVRAQVPNKPADYQLNHSTIIMPCNNSGESAAVARAAAARAAAWRRGTRQQAAGRCPVMLALGCVAGGTWRAACVCTPSQQACGAAAASRHTATSRHTAAAPPRAPPPPTRRGCCRA